MHMQLEGLPGQHTGGSPSALAAQTVLFPLSANLAETASCMSPNLCPCIMPTHIFLQAVPCKCSAPTLCPCKLAAQALQEAHPFTIELLTHLLHLQASSTGPQQPQHRLCLSMR